MTPPTPTLSVVIPLYNSAETILPLLEEWETLPVEGGVELVLVNDGSRDHTLELCRRFAERARVPIKIVALARNFGEHNAVVTGLRHASGRWIVTMDDDGQNPPGEALRLAEHARRTGLDVVYGHYAEKKHERWRNLGSAFCNRVADWVLDKPRGFYLSSFRCLNAFVAQEVSRYSGAFTYIDGLILQTTQSIGSLTVEHRERSGGRSGYTLSKLVRLWTSMFVNFSVLPLHLATLLGFAIAVGGFLATLGVVYLWITDQGPPSGWGLLMAALLVFSGTQLMVLGIFGEYLGRTYLSVNRRPQAVVREVIQGGPEARPIHRPSEPNPNG